MNIEENIYDKLHEFLGLEEECINILEENIDSNTQVEYFEYSRNYNIEKSEEEIMHGKDNLFDNTLSIDKKKSTLIELASINNIKAYRTIEKYLNEPDIKLYDWACLALQESKLQIESHLLDISKVLITTGLGGKGLKLRYFVALFSQNDNQLNTAQQDIIKKELEYYLQLNGSELEDIEFEDSFASVLTMIPLKVSPRPILRKVIEECNLFGSFLFNDFIITNVKALSTEEIREFLTVKNIY